MRIFLCFVLMVAFMATGNAAKAQNPVATSFVNSEMPFTDSGVSMAFKADKNGLFHNKWDGGADYRGLMGVQFSLADTVKLQVRGSTGIDGDATNYQAVGTVLKFQLSRFALQADASASRHDARMGIGIGFGL